MLWVISFCESSPVRSASRWLFLDHLPRSRLYGYFFFFFFFEHMTPSPTLLPRHVGRTVAPDGVTGLPQLRDTAQVWAIKRLPNTENILPGGLCHVFVAAAALNKYNSLGRCHHSSFKSDEYISALGFIITSVKIAVVLTITYKNREERQDGRLSPSCFFFFVITHNWGKVSAVNQDSLATPPLSHCWFKEHIARR